MIRSLYMKSKEALSSKLDLNPTRIVFNTNKYNHRNRRSSHRPFVIYQLFTNI